LWDLRVETFWFVLNYYQHENDQQHQENVNQGCDGSFGAQTDHCLPLRMTSGISPLGHARVW
jgi:hypothetical protein